MIFTSNIIIVFFTVHPVCSTLCVNVHCHPEGVKSRTMFTMYSLSPDFVTSVEAEVSLLSLFPVLEHCVQVVEKDI